MPTRVGGRPFGQGEPLGVGMRKLVALAMIAALLLPASTSAAPAVGRLGTLPISSLKASRDLGGPIFAQGTLRGKAGGPVAGRVVAVAFPIGKTLAKLKDGDSFKTIPLAQDVTGSNGVFQLRVDPAVDLAEVTEADGIINFDLVAEGPDGLGSYSMSSRAGSRDGSPAWVDAGDPTGPPAWVDISTGRFGSYTPTGPSTELMPAEYKDNGCNNYVLATADQIPVVIGETYPGPDARMTFMYKFSATSTLGAGYSINAGGSFSQNGTYTNSWSSGITWNERAQNTRTYYRTTFQYKKFDLYTLWDFGSCMHYGYGVRPTEYQGGATSYTPCCTPTANNCSPVTDSVVIHKTQGTAVTWTNGVQMSGQLGSLDLSAKTGFDVDTSYDVRFVTPPGQLCGSNNTSYPTAAQMVGKG